MGLKTTEILLIMGALLLLFGGARLPQLGSAMGSAIRNFKRSFGGEDTPAEEKKQPGTLSSAASVDTQDVKSRSTTTPG